MIVCEGKRAHLFYVGPDGNAEFENFELEVEVKTDPGANSGVYFLTKWQDSGWPAEGFEAQVNNTQPTFKEYDYRENKKTASLYGIRNLYKPLVQDGAWFTMNVKVTRPRVQIRLNGRLVSDYIEPANPVLPSPGPKLNLLGKGTFALQCHDIESRAYFRNIRVRRLPPGEDSSVTRPVLDEQDLRRLALGKDNFPIVNLRVQAGGPLGVAELEALRTRTGIFPGVTYRLNDFARKRSDAPARASIAALKDAPVFVGLDVSRTGKIEVGFGSPRLSLEAQANFDYLTATTGVKALLGTSSKPLDPTGAQALMEEQVLVMTEIIAMEPIDVFANVMVLPDPLAALAGELWTEERMQRVIAAAAKHGVAFEINLRERTPSERFIKLAKAATVKFTFGSDTTTAENYGDWSYALEMQKACGLTWKDMWVPGHAPTRAQREWAKHQP